MWRRAGYALLVSVGIEENATVCAHSVTPTCLPFFSAGLLRSWHHDQNRYASRHLKTYMLFARLRANCRRDVKQKDFMQVLESIDEIRPAKPSRPFDTTLADR